LRWTYPWCVMAGGGVWWDWGDHAIVSSNNAPDEPFKKPYQDSPPRRFFPWFRRDATMTETDQNGAIVKRIRVGGCSTMSISARWFKWWSPGRNLEDYLTMLMVDLYLSMLRNEKAARLWSAIELISAVLSRNVEGGPRYDSRCSPM
jgi:hypothetical protein